MRGGAAEVGVASDEEARLAHPERRSCGTSAPSSATPGPVALVLGHRNPQTTVGVYLEPFRALDVELLFEHAAGVPIAELLAAVWHDHPRVRTDPLAQAQPR
jgi:hypothetical protein